MYVHMYVNNKIKLNLVFFRHLNVPRTLKNMATTLSIALTSLLSMGYENMDTNIILCKLILTISILFNTLQEVIKNKKTKNKHYQ